MGGPEDRAQGLLAGADDFLIKPYDMRELMIRLHRLISNNSSCGRLDPITKLPSSQVIRRYIEEVCLREAEGKWALLEIDIKSFRAYNQVYGYEAGDRVLELMGDLLRKVIYSGTKATSFVGHDGRAHFVAVVHLRDLRAVSTELLSRFDTEILTAYPKEDRDNLYQVLIDRQGNTTQVPRIALSIGIVTSDLCESLTYLELRDVGAAVLSQAKREAQSSLFVNRRRLTRQRITQNMTG